MAPALTPEDLKDTQAGPVVPIPARAKIFYFFQILDAEKFCSGFKAVYPFVVDSLQTYETRTKIKLEKNLTGKLTPLAALSVAFSALGLKALSGTVPEFADDLKDSSFAAGQFSRREYLGDDKSKWLTQFEGHHGLFLLTGNPLEKLKDTLSAVVKKNLPEGVAIKVVFEHHGEARPGDQKGMEHFGWTDGVSQPYVRFESDPTMRRAPRPGQTVVDPGVLLLKQPGDHVDSETPRPDWSKNGSFLVYRHLKQLVPEFRAFLEDVVRKEVFPPGPTVPKVNLNDHDAFNDAVELLGARLVGRWKSGAPTATYPWKDNKEVGDDPNRNNDFVWNVKSSLECPFAAHTRKTGPRNDIETEAAKRGSIVRAGITYGPEVANAPDAGRGLAFVSFQSSVLNGFEFQQTGCSNEVQFPPNKPQEPGFDPIIGQKEGQVRTMSGYHPLDATKELELPRDFVITQGGEYYFLPSMTTLKKIAAA